VIILDKVTQSPKNSEKKKKDLRIQTFRVWTGSTFEIFQPYILFVQTTF
jgi:hypothetical protein